MWSSCYHSDSMPYSSYTVGLCRWHFEIEPRHALLFPKSIYNYVKCLWNKFLLSLTLWQLIVLPPHPPLFVKKNLIQHVVLLKKANVSVLKTFSGFYFGQKKKKAELMSQQSLHLHWCSVTGYISYCYKNENVFEHTLTKTFSQFRTPFHSPLHSNQRASVQPLSSSLPFTLPLNTALNPDDLNPKCWKITGSSEKMTKALL